LALEIHRDLSVGLVGDRIPLDLSAELALEIHRDLLAGLAVGRIPLVLSVESAAAATAPGCCDSRGGASRRRAMARL
jgi:hypothetical protein